MIFRATPIEGAFHIEPERRTDGRGYFARLFCADEYRRQGLSGDVAQSSVSYNSAEGTLRGLHFQDWPHGEEKLVRCVRGAIWDVILDLRLKSSTYLKWWGTELHEDSGVMLYVPEGVAHGFLTLQPTTEVSYQMSHPYVPESARGVRWDDPTFAIEWPSVPRVMSESDRTHPDFSEARAYTALSAE